MLGIWRSWGLLLYLGEDNIEGNGIYLFPLPIPIPFSKSWLLRRLAFVFPFSSINIVALHLRQIPRGSSTSNSAPLSSVINSPQLGSPHSGHLSTIPNLIRWGTKP